MNIPRTEGSSVEDSEPSSFVLHAEKEKSIAAASKSAANLISFLFILLPPDRFYLSVALD